MNNFSKELEIVKVFDFIVLLTLSNNADIHTMLLLNNLNLENGSDEMKIDSFVRKISNGGRVLGIIEGNFVSMDKKKLYYGKKLIMKESFMNIIRCSFDPRDNEKEVNEEIRLMELFFKDK